MQQSKWTQSGGSRGNKCTAPNSGQSWRGSKRQGFLCFGEKWKMPSALEKKHVTLQAGTALATSKQKEYGLLETCRKKWLQGALQQGADCALLLTYFTGGIYCCPAFEEVELLSEGELAHTCITEEGTPVHPAASTGKVDPANPGVKTDQRTGLGSSALHTTWPFVNKKKEKNRKGKKVTSIDFWGLQWLNEKGGELEEVSRRFFMRLQHFASLCWSWG